MQSALSVMDVFGGDFCFYRVNAVLNMYHNWGIQEKKREGKIKMNPDMKQKGSLKLSYSPTERLP